MGHCLDAMSGTISVKAFTAMGPGLTINACVPQSEGAHFICLLQYDYAWACIATPIGYWHHDMHPLETYGS